MYTSVMEQKNTVGYGVVIGALIAGITLSISPYRFEISSKMRPLRDFFLLIFFIFLGSQMVISDIASYIPQIAIFSVALVLADASRYRPVGVTNYPRFSGTITMVFGLSSLSKLRAAI